MSERARIGFIGLSGWAASLAAIARAAGGDVVGFDRAAPADTVAELSDSISGAAAGAAAVLSFAPPSLVRRSASEAAAALAAEALYADFGAVSPDIKQSLAGSFAPGAYIDATVIDPLPGDSRTPPLLLASGPRARDLCALLASSGIAVEHVSDRVGDATSRRLVRSILVQSMAAAIIDTLWAAQEVDAATWAYQEVLRSFESMSSDTARGLLTDTVRNVKPRQIEMMNVSEMLGGTGYTSTTADGIALTYSRLLHSVKVPYSHAP